MASMEYKINFNKESDNFTLGESVSGEISLELLGPAGPVTTKGLMVSCIGRSWVHFSKPGVRGDVSGKSSKEKAQHPETTTYTIGMKSEEVFFEQYHFIIGDYSGIQVKLAPGNHTYSFSFKLHSDLPASFDGAFGGVEYFIKVTNQTEEDESRTTKRPFRVTGRLDLTDFNAEIVERGLELEAHLPCLWCRGRKVMVKGEINKTEFILGEPIKFRWMIQNQWKETLTEVEIRLVQDSTYLAGGESMRYGRVILKEVLGDDGVKPWEVKMWDGSTGEIPLDLPPVDFGHSVPNISLKYLVSVRVAIPGRKGEDIYGEIPIILGTELYRNIESS